MYTVHWSCIILYASIYSVYKEVCSRMTHLYPPWARNLSLPSQARIKPLHTGLESSLQYNCFSNTAIGMCDSHVPVSLTLCPGGACAAPWRQSGLACQRRRRWRAPASAPGSAAGSGSRAWSGADLLLQLSHSCPATTVPGTQAEADSQAAAVSKGRQGRRIGRKWQIYKVKVHKREACTLRRQTNIGTNRGVK